jgi:hypothetical protein
MRPAEPRGSTRSPRARASATSAPRALLADLSHAGVQPGEPGLDAAQRDLRGLRRLDVPRAAREQRGAQLVLQALDLPAHRRLGEERFLGRGAEAGQPPH